MPETDSKKAHTFFTVLNCICFFIYTASAVVLSIVLVKLPILPLKFFLPIIIILAALAIIFLVLLFKKTKIITQICCMIFELAFTALIGFAFFYFGSTINFFDSIKPHDYQIEEYYVLVPADSEVQTLDDLKDHTIAIYDDSSENYQTALKRLNQKSTLQNVPYNNLGEAITAIVNRTAESIFIKGVMADIASEIFTTFDIEEYRIVENIQIRIEVDAVESEELDMTRDSFNIYISGIDTYGDITTVSRSDVNIVVTVNPRTHTILLTTVPRDYEVQLHGTTGLMDKLTHAGLYGVNMSIQTIEDLLDIGINYYVRINFDSTIKLIDSLGGVEVTPDATFYRPKYNCHFREGITMHLDGSCALTYARERKVYGLGDLHRIQNQQDILSAMINKLTSSKTLLTNYTNILASLSDSIETNIPSDQFYRLINLQLDAMPSWNLERNTVNGTEIHVPTYTIPDQILFVFQQDAESIEAASLMIHEVMDAN